ncbi:DUF742 domain-containing protein [Streptomyces noursei]|uniref:DUF742 domain-containing protein n=1 Tax=Streptomyces noursei TaxID=1971 RepID=UPI00082CDA6C|nr:DUF742 domain-containing protein [Streptomyces noursei]MCZ1013177.1 DUF742 domain-containing protein [Streptomyces noursei]GGX27501.1 hypothetical protein GCM10010341_56310 [Streptomyces noursei]
MSDSKPEKHRNWEEGGPERLYVLTSGRSAPSEAAPLDMVTLIVTRHRPTASMQPEQAAILRICDYPLSIAEISAYVHLPVSVVTVLLADLLESGHAEARAPIPTASLPDVELLEAVMHGLQNL